MFDVFTKRGTKIRPYKGQVGKQVGDQLYVHRDYLGDVGDFIPSREAKMAEERLQRYDPEYYYRTVMYDRKKKQIRFDEMPDFDTSTEPHQKRMISVYPDGRVVDRVDPNSSIIHHKQLFVKPDYKGFDSNKAWERSRFYAPRLPEVPKGTFYKFHDQLRRYKIE
jgi:hypothetical protein